MWNDATMSGRISNRSVGVGVQDAGGVGSSDDKDNPNEFDALYADSQVSVLFEKTDFVALKKAWLAQNITKLALKRTFKHVEKVERDIKMRFFRSQR